MVIRSRRVCFRLAQANRKRAQAKRSIVTMAPLCGHWFVTDSHDRSFQVEQDVWVSPSSGIRYQKDTKKWKVQAKGQTLGYYDKLIIAHNGKCADRIMSKTPSKDVHALLRVNFAPTGPAHGGKKMTLNSIYSLAIALPKDSELSQALKESFVSGFVKNHPNLRMITCQTRKYPDPGPNNKNSHAHEVWTVLSSAKFAKKYKAPQEAGLARRRGRRSDWAVARGSRGKYLGQTCGIDAT